MLRLASRTLQRPALGRVGRAVTAALLRPSALRAVGAVRPLSGATDAAKPADASDAKSAAATAAAAAAAAPTPAAAAAAAAAAPKAEATPAAAAPAESTAESTAADAAADAAEEEDSEYWLTRQTAAEAADFWAVTREKVAALDDLLKGRHASVVLADYENPQDLWAHAVRIANARVRHNAKTQYGETLGETRFPAKSSEATGADADLLKVGVLQGRTYPERKRELETRDAADKALLEAAAQSDPEMKQKLIVMRREWGTELKAVSARNAPAEVWRATIAKKYPNLSWDEIQREMRDTDADFWNPLEPAPLEWQFRTQPAMYRRPETTAGETRQDELITKFKTMVNMPWVMHETRSVNIMSRGKQQAFKCMVFAGNNNGFGGYSIGRAESPQLAQEKALKTLMNHMIFLPRLRSRTLFHNAEGRFNAVRARFTLRKPGTGNKAPDFGMIVLNGFGIDDVALSIWGGANPYTWMHAIFDGLLQQTSNRARALARGQRLYRELDYNDIPVPAPDEAEWEAQTERVRDAVIDQVYINPVVYPERMASADEKRNPWAPVQGPLPYKGFAMPYHQATNPAGERKWAKVGRYSARYKSWMGDRNGWKIATLHEAETDTSQSAARNYKF